MLGNKKLSHLYVIEWRIHQSIDGERGAAVSPTDHRKSVKFKSLRLSLMCFMADASALSPLRVIYGRTGSNGGSSHMPINTVVILAFRIARTGRKM